MYLKSIELTGFKSFAKKSELVFSSPISSIVGPNGSGKSNVAEAFRFVLGEQSIKSMRGKRGEDLIWNGASTEPRANRASVRLVFDNESRAFNIDFPEVVIERVVHRDGVNEYLLNGSKVRLKDVLELLSGAKIGTSGHHIISQGEADRVLSSSPRERKSFVEDALGLRLWEYKRIESERKLKATFDNISQVESLRKEIAPHLRFLKKQVEKIEKVATLQEELLGLSKVYFKREYVYLESAKKAIETEKKPLEDRQKKLGEELMEAKEVLKKSAESDKKEYAVLELEREISAVRISRDALSRELGKTEGLISAEERNIKKEKELIARNEHKLIPLGGVEKLLESLTPSFDEAEKSEDVRTLRSIIDRMRERFVLFIKESKDDSGSLRLAEAESALERFREEKGKMDDFVRAEEEKERKLVEKYESLKRDIEKERDTSHDAEKAVFRIMSEDNDVRSKLSLVRSKEEKVYFEEEEFKRDLEEVARILGADAMRFREVEMGSSEEILREERKEQEGRRKMLERMKIRLEEAGVSGAEDVLKEFRETRERDEFLEKELEDLDKSAETLRELIKSLEERLKEEFSSGLSRINKEFGELFVSMFGGGEARLVLTKESSRGAIDVLLEPEEESVEEGLDISVSLPRKKIRSLMMLSGGERALTSIALIFAISQVNPPPFIILDETDAALDEANSKKYGDMVEKLSEKSQLILITHNRETMSRAGVIYGVTISSSGASKLLSISFDKAVEVAK